MIEDDTQNSRHAASAAFHNAPRLTKIAQAGMQGGPTGAAAEAAVQYRKEVLIVVIAVLLLPVLVLLMLPGAIFGGFRHTTIGEPMFRGGMDPTIFIPTYFSPIEVVER